MPYYFEDPERPGPQYPERVEANFFDPVERFMIQFCGAIGIMLFTTIVLALAF